ncbi:MAG: cobalamin-independent methionine synthase II family protein [Actinomycetota bacterium]
MSISTTCLGAYPKPATVPISDWFNTTHRDDDYTDRVMRGWAAAQSAETQAILDEATAEVVADQIDCGIDVITDGEVRRENYVHYQCRHFEGFDFEHLTRRVLRNGAYATDLPSIRGPVRTTGQHPLVRDWQVATAASDGRPVKATLPGPMTISDTTADCFYDDPAELAGDLATALNAEVQALVDAGCTHIQIDEPIFARKPDQALAYGIDALRACFEGVPDDITRVMHMCCGYPNHLDDHDYPKADASAYLQLAQAVDGVVDQISIEDAHRHNPPELFEAFERSTLIVGFVRIASSDIESTDDIATRIHAVRDRLPDGRLIAAPDCGLGFLGRDLAMAKLRNLSAAAALA